MDISRFNEVVLAAWLHDVGKFAQRADVQELFNKERDGQLCKLHKGGWYSHQHVIYTEGFLEKYKDVLPDGIIVSNVIELAANHHNPSSFLEWLISEADCLSSGSDRCKVLDDVGDDCNNGSILQFFEKPMFHLLSTLKLPETQIQPNFAYCNLKPLENDAILSSSVSKLSKADYLLLWKCFENDFQKLKGLNIDEFLLALNSLLERYWWCIPSATNSDADISLYQHAKTTAAFAATLFKFHQENETEIEAEQISEIKNISSKKFMFINGDISGIQKYIFDLKTTEDNAKLLRAKSFQLWALSEILSEYIVKQFDVTYANIITSAGGKFIILLPNTKKAKVLLPQIQLEIEEYFLKEFAGKLAVIISDGVEADSSDMQKAKAQQFINKIGHQADIDKQKKMQKVLQKEGAVLDSFYNELQKNGECPKCGIFPSLSSDGKTECKNCQKLTDIGRDLVKAAQIQLKYDTLGHFGDMVKVERNNKSFGYTVNDYVPGKPVMYIPYVAPWKNEENGELKTFEDIASEINGNHKLAMFKADIDNLGLIFSSSLAKRMSFSRYSDLSHILHYFFSSYYAWFVKNKSDKNGKPYSETIYTVFSGGDDLCILGAWDSVMHFAADFRKELCKLTNNNSLITISGGISLFNSNIPVRNMAEETEQSLEKSKSYKTSNGMLKNAITAFGTTVSWGDFDKCISNGKKLQDCLEKNKINPKDGISKGIIYKMLDFANCAEKVKNGNIKELTWISHFRYVAVRNITDEKIKKWFLEFGTPEEMIKSRIAVSYALYTQR